LFSNVQELKVSVVSLIGKSLRNYPTTTPKPQGILPESSKQNQNRVHPGRNDLSQQRFQIQPKLQKEKNWIAIEAETAISQLPPQEQDGLRHRVAHNLKQLYKRHDPAKPNHSEQYNSGKAKKEFRNIKKIKEKLDKNNALALETDKGNSIVIEYAEAYSNKVTDFISSNEFQITEKDPTKRFQNKIRTIIRECQLLIHKEKRYRYVN
jgi:hypothetical protein